MEIYRKSFFLLLSIAFAFRPVTADQLSGSPEDFSTGWEYAFVSEDFPDHKLEDNVKNLSWKPVFGLSKFPDRNKAQIGIFRKLLPKSPKEYSIFFHSIDQSFKIYLHHSLNYQFAAFTKDALLKGIYWPWHLINVSPDFGGKYIYIEAYSELKTIGPFGKMQLGDRAIILKDMFQNDLDYWILGSLFIVSGLLQWFFYFRQKGERAYFSLGIFSISIGVYMISRTYTKLLFIQSNPFWLHVELLSNYLFPVGIISFADFVFGKGKYFQIRILWILHSAFALLAILLPIFGIMSIVNTLYYSNFLVLFSAIFLLGQSIINAFVLGREARIFLIGFTILVLFGVHSLLVQFNIISWTRTMHQWGVFFFMLSLAFILVERYNNIIKKLEFSTLELKQQSMVKDRFLSNLSHELRTPLTAIYGFAELIDPETVDIETNKSYLKEVITESEKLQEKINDLILLTELESGFTIKRHQENIKGLIQKAIENNHELIETRKIKIYLDFSGDLNVDVEPKLLLHCLDTIIKNAILYNKIEGNIHISIFPFGKFIKIMVSDSGYGIKPENMNKVFEKFFREDTSLNYEVSGTGTGLFIAKKIIELHHGEIYAESQLGEGTTIKILIPIKK